MAALTAADFSVAITDQVIIGRKRFVFGTLTLTNTSNTYPTAGIPLPAIGSFAMKQRMDALLLFGLNGLTSDYATRWNKSAHALQLFEEEGTAAGGPLLEADTSEAPATRSYDFLAIGW